MSTQPEQTITLAPQQMAEACADALYQRDLATRHLGIEINSVAPGQAVVSMTVKDFMIQGHQTCHGGYLFTLADSAFAFACNSYNAPTVAAGCSIEYLSPAREGDVLTATAMEQSRGSKLGVYDITIRNQHGQDVALFRGKSYQLRGEILSA